MATLELMGIVFEMEQMVIKLTYFDDNGVDNKPFLGAHYLTLMIFHIVVTHQVRRFYCGHFLIFNNIFNHQIFT